MYFWYLERVKNRSRNNDVFGCHFGAFWTPFWYPKWSKTSPKYEHEKSVEKRVKTNPLPHVWGCCGTNLSWHGNGKRDLFGNSCTYAFINDVFEFPCAGMRVRQGCHRRLEARGPINPKVMKEMDWYEFPPYLTTSRYTACKFSGHLCQYLLIGTKLVQNDVQNAPKWGPKLFKMTSWDPPAIHQGNRFLICRGWAPFVQPKGSKMESKTAKKLL